MKTLKQAIHDARYARHNAYMDKAAQLQPKIEREIKLSTYRLDQLKQAKDEFDKVFSSKGEVDEFAAEQIFDWLAIYGVTLQK